MIVRAWWLAGLLTVCSSSAWAQDAGGLGVGGRPIVPAEEGRLLRLSKHPVAGQPVYSLVHSGGEPVLVMTSTGAVLTPDEAWEEFGGKARQAAPGSSASGGTFSVPNKRH